MIISPLLRIFLPTRSQLTPTAELSRPFYQRPNRKVAAEQDVHWYNRDVDDNAEWKQEELRRIKEAEKEALAVALYVSGFLRMHTL